MAHEPRYFSVAVPPAAAWNPQAATHLVETLLRAVDHLPLALCASHDRVDWFIGNPLDKLALAQVEHLARTYYPKAEVTPTDYLAGIDLDDPDQFPFWRAWRIFGRERENLPHLPLKAVTDIDAADDPLQFITHAMSNLIPGEHLWFFVLVSDALQYSGNDIKRLLTVTEAQAGVGRMPRLIPRQIDWNSGTSVGRALGEEMGAWIARHRHRVSVYSAQEEQWLLAKLTNPVYRTFVMMQLDTADRERLRHLDALTAPIRSLGIPGFGSIGPVAGSYTRARLRVDSDALIEKTGVVTYLMDQAFALAMEADQGGVFRDRRRQRELEAFFAPIEFHLSPAEIAALWHLPHEGFSAGTISWAGLPFPEALTGAPGARVCFGVASYRGAEHPLYLTAEDRAHHAYITGKTGMGKSTLLHNLIHQDIAAGRGVGVIDPHGPLIEWILAHSIPDDRRDDVVLLECGRTDYPVPLNPLRIPDGVSPEAAFNYVYWVLRRIYQSVWIEGQTDRVLRHVLRTLLLADPEATPLDIQRVLNHAGYRARLVDALTGRGTRAIRAFWADYDQQSRSMHNEMTRPVLNRTEAFLDSPAMELMACHPHALNFQAMIAEGKIVLVNLAGEAIQAEVDSLGTMLLAAFYMAFHALGPVADPAAPRFFLYVDEVERFVTSPLPEMFSEARKFGMGLMMANQVMERMAPEALSGILGNVGTLLTFEIGDQDAHTYAPLFAPTVDRHVLLNLGKAHIAGKTRFAGKTLEAFVARTLPPPAPGTARDAAALRQRAVRQLGLLHADAVDAWLAARYEADDAAATLTGPAGLQDFDPGDAGDGDDETPAA